MEYGFSYTDVDWVETVRVLSDIRDNCKEIDAISALNLAIDAINDPSILFDKKGQKESPENELRRKSRKCKFCKHCRTEIVEIDRDISWCDVREELVNPGKRKMFCSCFMLEEFD